MSNLFSSGGAGNVGASEGIDQQSLKFNDDESQYLSWTPAAAGNRKTWTWSGWVKRGNIGTSQIFFNAGADVGQNYSRIYFENDYLNVRHEDSNVANIMLTTTRIFRDVSAWYHIVFVADTTQSTAANRIKLYVNGLQISDFSTATYPSQNFDTDINSTDSHSIGARTDGSVPLDGYLSDIHFIDGQALDPTSFGQFTNGYWEAKDYAGTYGTNGFHLTFEDDVVSEGFNAVTYRGNGGSQSISGLGFEPDFVWIKDRGSPSSHDLFDTVRGAEKLLYTNGTGAEISGYQGVTSFNSDGFTVGPTNDSSSGNSYVAWAWDAGSGSAASNTDGSITSTVKANPSYGFSITSFVGNGTLNATVGHGLSSAPEIVLVKNRSTAVGWLAWHKDLSGATYRMDLNGDGAEYNDGNGALQGVSSSLLTLGSLNAVNQNSANMIAYCWHSVAGYSKISSYSGTGVSGNAVTGLGFEPAWLMIKRSDSGGASWRIYDNTRNTSDPRNSLLYPDVSGAEYTAAANNVDFDADGFTINGTSAGFNASGGTYIYMAFADTREAAFWKDVSGQGNHWTPNNLDYRDSLPDSPANNFATFSPLVRRSDVTTLPTFSEGNLKVVYPDAGGNVTYAAGTIPITSGKWYYETKIDSLTTNNVVVGWATEDEIAGTSSHVMISGATGGIFIDGSLQSTEGALSVGDIIGTTIDLDNGYVGFYKNGVALSFSPSISITSANWWNSGGLQEFLFAWNRGSTSDGTSANFGQDSTFAGAKPMGAFTDDNSIGNFQYAPPAGYLALCTANLPTPTIVDGSDYFETVLYTGDGTSSNQISVNFAPDFTWMKPRNQARSHRLVDSVRGYPVLSSDSTAAEGAGGYLRLNSTGFLLTTSAQDYNGSGNTYASWNWKAGGTAVSNTDGSITSQVSANVGAGFSVVSWTGAGGTSTVGHGLGVQPSMIIAKNRDDGTRSWIVYHKDVSSAPETDFLRLESTNAVADYPVWGDTAPTSSVFTVGDASTNGSGDAMIAYCFADVEGFSKAGSYTGNGSSDGPFVYTGFRPAWVMIKRTNNVEDWLIVDATRSTHNDAGHTLWPNLSDAENNYSSSLDLVSNGFKLRNSGGLRNGNGDTYIYLAFAENPFKYANAR